MDRPHFANFQSLSFSVSRISQLEGVFPTLNHL